MIEQRYQEIIDQCMARINDLTEWEQTFMLGDPARKGKPITDRTWLSDGQKKVLDRIVSERFEGKKYERKFTTKFGPIDAMSTDDGWKITIGNYPIGKGITKKEAGEVAAWLSTALSGILSVPKEILIDFMNGTKAEMPDEPSERETASDGGEFNPAEFEPADDMTGTVDATEKKEIEKDEF